LVAAKTSEDMPVRAPHHPSSAPRYAGVAAILGGFTCLVVGFTWASIHFRFPLPPEPNFRQILKPALERGKVVVRAPGYVFMGDIAIFHDEMFAFLMFDHYRSLPELKDGTLYLTSVESGGQPEYRISLLMPDSLQEGIGQLTDLRKRRLIENFSWGWVAQTAVAQYGRETAIFIGTWTTPARIAVSDIKQRELQGYLRRFIRFKSLTDPRIERSVEAIPSPLSRQDASRLAADIIDVADFYQLPLGLLLGIGAMENNYMNVPGDLHNTIWKRRAEKGDVVLRRRRGMVLVRNDSVGVWQITRESLRYAHQLYLADNRNYDALPERLRPPKKLDMDHVSTDLLTTYAGLLLRNLLDRFDGDVARAAGAYNGGVARPNQRYATGVQKVAEYARRMIQSAAANNLAKARNATRHGLEQPAMR